MFHILQKAKKNKDFLFAKFKKLKKTKIQCFANFKKLKEHGFHFLQSVKS